MTNIKFNQKLLCDSRGKLGWSYREVAKRSGVTERTVISILTDAEYNPTIKSLQGVAAALGLSIQEVFIAKADHIDGRVA